MNRIRIAGARGARVLLAVLASVVGCAVAPTVLAAAGAAAGEAGGRSGLAGATAFVVLVDTSAEEEQAQREKARRGLASYDRAILAQRARAMDGVKDRVMRHVAGAAIRVKRRLANLPLVALEVRDDRSLAQLRAAPGVLAVFPDTRLHPALDSVSAALVGQPLATAAGGDGAGASIAIIDSGVDYGQADLGPCTAPGVPAATCRVVRAENLAGSGGPLDTSTTQHGTNIAAIAAGVAPRAKIVSLNVFGSSASASVSTVLDAVDWAIANQATYGIRAMNLSISDGTANSSPCGNRFANPFVTAFASARAAGIIPVVSSGNNAYQNAIGNPACTPGAVSVGAVYSQDWGPTSGGCSDASTAADKVTCFSNSASFLTLLAPGAFITAGGRQLAGTSQAAPFVAGAVAVLRAAFPSETVDQTVDRLVSRGRPVTDARNGIVTPRLAVHDSLRPPNDDFALAQVIAGATGLATGSNLFGTRETGEPQHAGQPGSDSTWWRWQAPAGGVLAVDTAGSSFDTLLGIYTGDSLAALAVVGGSDDESGAVRTSRTWVLVAPGAVLRIAVDGKAGATGSIRLNWALDTSPSADVRVTVAVVPPNPVAGQLVALRVTATNRGPSGATGVVASGPVPAGFAFAGASAPCTSDGVTFQCPFGAIGPGASAEALVWYRAQRSGSASFQASVSSTVPDPVPGDNTAVASATISPAVRTTPLPGWSGAVLGALLVAIALSRGRGA